MSRSKYPAIVIKSMPTMLGAHAHARTLREFKPAILAGARLGACAIEYVVIGSSMYSSSVAMMLQISRNLFGPNPSRCDYLLASELTSRVDIFDAPFTAPQSVAIVRQAQCSTPPRCYPPSSQQITSCHITMCSTLLATSVSVTPKQIQLSSSPCNLVCILPGTNLTGRLFQASFP